MIGRIVKLMVFACLLVGVVGLGVWAWAGVALFLVVQGGRPLARCG